MNSSLSRSDAPSQTHRSPDGQITLRVGEFRPVGRGGPKFARVRVPGHELELDGRKWGEPIAFAPDSRYLALVELADLGTPTCKVVVFDFKLRIERTVLTLSPGFVRGLAWRSGPLLEMDAWTLRHDTHRATWVPPQGAPELPWWRFWRRRREWRRMICLNGAQRMP